MVEKLVKGQQAELSDIKVSDAARCFKVYTQCAHYIHCPRQVGDKLVAVDHFNVTGVSAKNTQRIMSSLPFPRTLVFEARCALSPFCFLLWIEVTDAIPQSDWR